MKKIHCRRIFSVLIGPYYLLEVEEECSAKFLWPALKNSLSVPSAAVIAASCSYFAVTSVVTLLKTRAFFESGFGNYN